MRFLQNRVQIHVFTDGVKYEFDVLDIEEVVMITKDLGPLYDDMCLAIRIDKETAIFIMSEHKSYKSFLFDQLGKAISLDFEKIIQAMKMVIGSFLWRRHTKKDI